MNATLANAQHLMPAIEFFGSAGDYAELSEEMDARVRDVLACGQVLQGAAVAQLEERLAAITGRRHAVAVGSGTDALYFALKSAGIGPRDEVLVPVVTFVASASAILRTGAKPVFVDMGDGSEIDLEAAERAITPATRALLHVHLFGGMGDPKPVEDFVASHSLLLIEDFAQSFGASYGKRPAGSLGLASATSFDPTKVIGAPGSGGALVTDDKRIAAQARRLRLHGKDGPGFAELGFNSQMPTLAAAIIDLKLDRHSNWTRRRSSIAARFQDGLSALPISFWPTGAKVHHVWHKFILLAERRDELASWLKLNGIPTRIHYERPLHREALFHSTQSDSEFPRAMDYCRRTLSLPIHSHLTNDQVETIIEVVRDFFDA